MENIGDDESILVSTKIRIAFDLFDAEKSDSISEKEVPSALRYLGIFPGERELVREIIEAMKDDDPSEGIQFRNFHKIALQILDEKKYEPASADRLVQAFRLIDAQNLGYIDSDVMERLLLTKGEPFRQQELEDFWTAARDQETGRIYYEEYVALATKGRY